MREKKGGKLKTEGSEVMKDWGSGHQVEYVPCACIPTGPQQLDLAPSLSLVTILHYVACLAPLVTPWPRASLEVSEPELASGPVSES